MVSSVVMAQDTEPSYKADPGVYKVIFVSLRVKNEGKASPAWPL